jgi:hypothetical protein
MLAAASTHPSPYTTPHQDAPPAPPSPLPALRAPTATSPATSPMSTKSKAPLPRHASPASRLRSIHTSKPPATALQERLGRATPSVRAQPRANSGTRTRQAAVSALVRATEPPGWGALPHARTGRRLTKAVPLCPLRHSAPPSPPPAHSLPGQQGQPTGQLHRLPCRRHHRRNPQLLPVPGQQPAMEPWHGGLRHGLHALGQHANGTCPRGCWPRYRHAGLWRRRPRPGVALRGVCRTHRQHRQFRSADAGGQRPAVTKGQPHGRPDTPVRVFLHGNLSSQKVRGGAGI